MNEKEDYSEETTLNNIVEQTTKIHTKNIKGVSKSKDVIALLSMGLNNKSI